MLVDTFFTGKAVGQLDTAINLDQDNARRYLRRMKTGEAPTIELLSSRRKCGCALHR